MRKIAGVAADTRYSQGDRVEIRKELIVGPPDWRHISTSYVERQNLTLRMRRGRFARLTSGFGKRFANLEAAVALHDTHYNLVRRHMAIRVSPAMNAGVERRLWSPEELVALID